MARKAALKGLFFSPHGVIEGMQEIIVVNVREGTVVYTCSNILEATNYMRLAFTRNMDDEYAIFNKVNYDGSRYQNDRETYFRKDL